MNDNIIIHKIGLKYKLSDEEVEEIVKLAYKFVRNVIESGNREKMEFKNIKVPGLGTFCVSEKAKNKWRELNENYKFKSGNTSKQD